MQIGKYIYIYNPAAQNGLSVYFQIIFWCLVCLECNGVDIDGLVLLVNNMIIEGKHMTCRAWLKF